MSDEGRKDALEEHWDGDCLECSCINGIAATDPRNVKNKTA